MRIRPFELERWQSVWEHQVELNISESGVLPMVAAHLADDPADLDKILALPLGYPQTNGSLDLRQHIAALYPVATPDNVLVTCGGAEANFLCVWSRIEPGDEVVVMQPNYGQVAGLAESFGAVVRAWWLREDLRWQGDPAELAQVVNAKTKIIAVCNPNNPTGAIMSAAAMQAVVDAAARVGAWILADEIYSGAEMPSRTPAVTPSFWGRYDRVLCTSSLSKAYGLPGLRTGWVVAPPEIAAELWGHHDYTSIGPSVVNDRLAALALAPEKRAEILERTRRIIGGNYPPLADWLARHPEFRHIPPAAGAIAWFACPGSAELARRAREEKSVLLCPGEQFDMPNYMRIGFGGHTGELLQALGRIEELLLG
jgi:aspartate/methionine/tyrosine aminotransferase